jgi:transcriptional regulator with XRE-family HTH domain
LVGDVRDELLTALAEERERRNLTRARVAALIGKDKGFVSRKLNGIGNMTLRTLADLAWALDRPIRIRLPNRMGLGGGNARATDAANAHHVASPSTGGSNNSASIDPTVQQDR